MTKLRRALLIPLLLMATQACAALPTTPDPTPIEPVCSTQALNCYHFEGRLQVGGAWAEVEGWSQDMPAPGYANRWRYVISAPTVRALDAYSRPTPARVGGAAVVWPGGGGGMYQEALAPSGAVHWRLEMYPTEPGVADAFRALAGAHEYRHQAFEVRPIGNGSVELLITEPAGR